MPRLVDTLSNKSPFIGHNAPIVDIKQGGQFGHMINYKALVSSTPYVRQHIVAVLIQAPRGYDLLDDPQSWYKSLKAIVEEQSREITGLQSTLQIANVEHDFGGAGEKISAVSNVTRSTSEPSHSIPEKYNMPVSLFINSWILELMMDPETKYPNIITRLGADVTDHLVDFYSATVLYFEPDPTFRNVLKAWLCAAWRPATEGAAIEGSRSLTSDKEDLVIDLRLTSTTESTPGVIELAQKILNTLRVAIPSPQQRPAMYDDIEAKVKAVNDTGYKESMDAATAVAMQP